MSTEQHEYANDAPSVLSPVLQLFIILIPTVANAFLLVYLMLGLVLTDERHATWAIEAPTAGFYVALLVWGFSMLVLAVMRMMGLHWRRPLAVVSWVQIALAAVLYGTIQLLA